MRNTSYVSSVDSTGPEEANLQIFAIYGVQEALTVLFMDHLLRKSKWEMLGVWVPSFPLLPLFSWPSVLYSMYGSTQH